MMFDRSTFIQHTNNISGNSKTVAGVKAPFSLNEKVDSSRVNIDDLMAKYVRRAVTRVSSIPRSDLSVGRVKDVIDFGDAETKHVDEAHQDFITHLNNMEVGHDKLHPKLSRKAFFKQVERTLQ